MRRPIKTATASPAILQGHRGRDSQRLKEVLAMLHVRHVADLCDLCVSLKDKKQKKTKNVQEFHFK